MTKATDKPNQETLASQYINQGQIYEGSLNQEGFTKVAFIFNIRITRISLHRIT
jgi:hypothetical protein